MSRFVVTIIFLNIVSAGLQVGVFVTEPSAWPAGLATMNALTAICMSIGWAE